MELATAVGVSLAAFLIFLALHVMVWRTREGKYRGVYLLVVIAVISYLSVCLIGSVNFGQDTMSHFWTSAPFFFCGIMGYSHCYVGMLKSVSIRIIEELAKRPDGRLTLNQLGDHYPVREMFVTRLSLLEEKRWISKHGDRYVCLSKASRVAAINRYLHRAFWLDRTG